MNDLTLKIEGLVVRYSARTRLVRGRRRTVERTAVQDVSLAIKRATTMALVGESGSGKTSVARAIIGLPVVQSGRIWIDGVEITASKKPRPRDTGRLVQMVFQQPSGSLDPKMRIGATIGEPLAHLLGLRGRELQQRVHELLVMVGLDPEFAQRYPRQLSGGQRQRVAVARALAPSPALIVCDEPTSSLDVSVQAQIINLLVELQERLGLTFLFISHDLGVVRQVADEVAVMSQGKIVEVGDVDSVLDRPEHPYTQRLLAAVPSVE